MISKDPASTLFRPKNGPVKRRQTERHRCKGQLIGHLVIAGGNEKLEAWVRDLSEKGLGLIVAKKLDIGSKANFMVKKNAAVQAMKIPVTVIHCQAESDCCWHIGFEFNDALPPALLEYFIR